MKINENFIKLLESFCTDKTELAQGLIFGFIVHHKKDFPSLERYLLESNTDSPLLGRLKYEDYQRYAINLVKVDTSTGIEQLIVPLYSVSTSEQLDLFKSKLLERHINNLGHLNNQLEFSIFSEDDAEALELYITKKGEEFNIEKLADIAALYYKKASFAKKLCKFLKEDV